MRKTIQTESLENYVQMRLVEETLSDNSKVYDIELQHIDSATDELRSEPVVLCLNNRDTAYKLFNILMQMTG